jgi:hypothetical protein
MKSILKNTYNDKIDERFIDRYLDKICENAEEKEIKVNIRNLYQYNYGSQLPINQVLLDVKNEHLNIHANGTYTENIKPVSYYIIDELSDQRSHYKDLMYKAKVGGDDFGFFINNGMQNTVKAKTNSIYGASTMKTGFTSNIDMGGAITAQARNFISEMVWNIERFIGNNYTFENMNEVFCWLDELFKLKSKIDYNYYISKYISYIPTTHDCTQKYVYITRDVKNIRKDELDISKSSFLMFDMMEEWKKVFFFYSYDPITLITLNPKIKKIVNDLVEYDITFINPYMFEKVKSNWTKEDVYNLFYDPEKNNVEEATKKSEFYIILKEFREIIKIFSFATIINGNRVSKYKTRRRKACVIGDTDSTMPSFYEITEDTFKTLNKVELMKNNMLSTKVAMSWISIVSDLMSEACMNFVVCCNQYNEGEKFYMYMKNEFFFPIVLLYNTKKNYIGIQTIQEGRELPENKQLAVTGRNLGSDTLNEYVSNETLDILNKDVLKAKEFNPLIVYQRVLKLRKHIEDSLKSGDITFGVYARYNGYESIKNPETTSNVRATIIWNNIYPEDTISPGDAMYVFNTSLFTEEDLNSIPDKYNDIKEKIRNVVFRRFGNFDFSRFGLKTFVIPAYGDTRKIPEWVLPFIDINDLCEKHLQPIVSLFPSLLLSPCSYVKAESTTKKMGLSSLINF